MKVISAFLRLTRWINLLFILLTQFLFRFCVVLPSFHAVASEPILTDRLFAWLVTASVCIAAAGYIINDYFDLNIDRINKPGKLIVGKIISRRWAMVWHLGLSVAGVGISFYVSWKIHNGLLVLFNILCVFLLWFYSTTFKRKLLIGNIVISLLTAWVVMVLYVCELDRLLWTAITPSQLHALSRIFRLAVLYGGFAFIISLIREVVKDVEDMPGDARYDCRTMPIVWGLNVSKVFVATWLVVLIAALGIVQVYALQLQWWWSALYCAAGIILPLLYIFRRLFTAVSVEDFHRLSSLVKLVMLTGIVSMVFFKIYA